MLKEPLFLRVQARVMRISGPLIYQQECGQHISERVSQAYPQSYSSLETAFSYVLVSTVIQDKWHGEKNKRPGACWDTREWH